MVPSGWLETTAEVEVDFRPNAGVQKTTTAALGGRRLACLTAARHIPPDIRRQAFCA
jgi:hypothetical protein